MRAITLLLVLALLFLTGCSVTSFSSSIATTTPNGGTEQMPVTLLKPDGPGPFPAVVIMHDCSGLGPRSSGAPDRWGKELLSQGYVILIPDSFTTRGHAGGVCTDPSPSRNEVSPHRRVRDAYAALTYLRSLPYVDGSRVGLMGGSHGGATTLAAMVAPNASPGFKAAVALYPECAQWLRSADVYRPAGPLLILIGEKDDWTPAEPCRRLTEASQQAGGRVTIKIYPGAYHSFDSANPVRYVDTRVNASSPTGPGATAGGDPEAWADSIREVVAFFDRYLR